MQAPDFGQTNLNDLATQSRLADGQLWAHAWNNLGEHSVK